MPSFNAIKIKELLPDLFAKSQHFTPEEYYQTMINICPELKKKWYERIPSESDIQKMITKQIGDGEVEGKTSVPTAEKILGVKIDPGYKYPDNMSDFQYNLYRFYKYGLFDVFRNNANDDYKACFDRVFRNGETIYSKKPSKERAYYIAWQKLHYPNRQEIITKLKSEWTQLCELNPILKSIRFDTNDAALLNMAIAGTVFGFPARDIEFFLTEHNTADKAVALRHRTRMLTESTNAGLPAEFMFLWVPHSDTIAEIGRQYREKNKNLQNAILQQTIQHD